MIALDHNWMTQEIRPYEIDRPSNVQRFSLSCGVIQLGLLKFPTPESKRLELTLRLTLQQDTADLTLRSISLQEKL
jgi:hypothetical protein